MKQRRLLDRKNINDFLGVIGNNKDAYDAFRQRLVNSDLTWAKELKTSQSKDRHNYFKSYIEPLQQRQR